MLEEYSPTGIGSEEFKDIKKFLKKGFDNLGSSSYQDLTNTLYKSYEMHHQAKRVIEEATKLEAHIGQKMIDHICEAEGLQKLDLRSCKDNSELFDINVSDMERVARCNCVQKYSISWLLKRELGRQCGKITLHTDNSGCTQLLTFKNGFVCEITIYQRYLASENNFKLVYTDNDNKQVEMPFNKLKDFVAQILLAMNAFKPEVQLDT